MHRADVAARVPLAIVLPLALIVPIAACAPPPAEPAAASISRAAPPWPAPRDAVSHIRLAGLEELRTGYRSAESLTARLSVQIDGEAVQVPAFIGIDRVRSVEAPLHTHTSNGVVWVEHPSALPATTLGEFFDLWGVRFDESCLGSACQDLTVTVDGNQVGPGAKARSVTWEQDLEVVIEATTQPGDEGAVRDSS